MPIYSHFPWVAMFYWITAALEALNFKTTFSLTCDYLAFMMLLNQKYFPKLGFIKRYQNTGD